MSRWGSDSDSDDDLDGRLHAEPAAEPAPAPETKPAPEPVQAAAPPAAVVEPAPAPPPEPAQEPVPAAQPKAREPYLRLLTLAAHATRRTPVLPAMRCGEGGAPGRAGGEGKGSPTPDVSMRFWAAASVRCTSLVR